MSINRKSAYSLDASIAEIYDRHETQSGDVEFIRRLIGGRGRLRIFEPFCGTGRILIPLALDGHEMAGMDNSEPMLDRLRRKVLNLPIEVQDRVSIQQADVLDTDWPGGFDVVLLGGNCFYELASPGEQEACIVRAAAALKGGGYVYVDNDHMEGELHESWRRLGRRSTGFPSGVCDDGTQVAGWVQTTGFDAARRIWKCRRGVNITRPDGTAEAHQWDMQKHPVSFVEVAGWLVRHGFDIEQTFGDRAGSPYADDMPRAVFWAKKSSPADA